MCTFGEFIVEGHFVFLQVDEEVGDEGEGLLFHESVHVLLADFDACDIDTLHLKL